MSVFKSEDARLNFHADFIKAMAGNLSYVDISAFPGMALPEKTPAHMGVGVGLVPLSYDIQPIEPFATTDPFAQADLLRPMTDEMAAALAACVPMIKPPEPDGMTGIEMGLAAASVVVLAAAGYGAASHFAPEWTEENINKPVKDTYEFLRNPTGGVDAEIDEALGKIGQSTGGFHDIVLAYPDMFPGSLPPFLKLPLALSADMQHSIGMTAQDRARVSMRFGLASLGGGLRIDAVTQVDGKTVQNLRADLRGHV